MIIQIGLTNEKETRWLKGQVSFDGLDGGVVATEEHSSLVESMGEGVNGRRLATSLTRSSYMTHRVIEK